MLRSSDPPDLVSPPDLEGLEINMLRLRNIPSFLSTTASFTIMIYIVTVQAANVWWRGSTTSEWACVAHHIKFGDLLVRKHVH